MVRGSPYIFSRGVQVSALMGCLIGLKFQV